MTTIGDVCEPPQYGWTTRAVPTGQIKLLRTTDISSGSIDWSAVPYCADVPDDLAKYMLRDGDIVISRSGSVGVSCLVLDPPPAVFASYLVRFRPKNVIDRRYLAHFLKSPAYWQQVHTLSSGIAMPNVNARKMRAVEMPLPSSDRQHEIARRLDEQTTQLAAAEAALVRASVGIRRYRQVLIELACSGRLSVGPRTDEERKSAGLGSRVTTLGEVLTQPLRNGHSARRDADGGVRIITLTAVTTGDFGSGNTKMTAADPSRVRELWLAPGDVLFERSNTADLVGTARIYRGPADYAIYPDLVIRARVNADVDLRYLELVLEWKRTRDYFRSRAVGIAGNMPKIDQATIAGMPLPLPSLADQRALADDAVARLDRLSALSAAVDAARRRVPRLRASVRDAAFPAGTLAA